jgi:hydroxyethylthiazole kinase-like uncharacterized protein yjeF
MLPDLAPIYRIAELRTLEAAAAGAPLMARAGRALATLGATLAGDHGGRIVVLAGPGNNGGDGFVAALALREMFHTVEVVFRGHADKLPRDAAAAHKAWLAAGGSTITEPPAGVPALVIDALFGIGITRPLTKPYAQLVEWANACGAPLLAADIPTGLNADTGIAAAPAIRADATLTFLGLKPGLLTAGGPDLCGQVNVDRLGIAADPHATRGHCLVWPAFAAALPDVLRRTARNVHKGTFGTLAVIGGAEGMLGAPLLAGRAALRLGAGKVQVGFAARHFPPVDTANVELMLHDAVAAFDGASALVIGPGLGRSDGAHALLMRAIATPLPAVFDADALNLISVDSKARSALASRSAATLVTPHPGEAARLLGTDTTAITRDRLGAALTLAQQLNAHVVIKGAGSVLAHPDHDWDINASGNPGLASAGTGDVLSGMLGALLAQRIDGKTALRLGVCLHGAAADALVANGNGPLGLPASEVADAARSLLNRVSR